MTVTSLARANGVINWTVSLILIAMSDVDDEFNVVVMILGVDVIVIVIVIGGGGNGRCDPSGCTSVVGEDRIATGTTMKTKGRSLHR